MISQILHQKTFEKTVSLHNSKFISNKRMYMNRIKVFLLFAVWIGLNACQSKGKQAIEKEVGEDTLIIAPTVEEKTITGVVGDASTNHFALITSKGDTLFISTMDQEPNDVTGFELGDTVRVNYIEEEEEPGSSTIPTAQKVVVIGKKIRNK